MIWLKVNIRGREFYILEQDRKKHEVYTRSGKLLCRFGQPGSEVKPGTKKGNNYCNRSNRIKITQPWYKSPNYWSRLRWSCQQGKSISRAEYKGNARAIKEPPFRV